MFRQIFTEVVLLTCVSRPFGVPRFRRDADADPASPLTTNRSFSPISARSGIRMDGHSVRKGESELSILMPFGEDWNA
jgi:hypothetical protein